jgi:hypothetical protein
MIFHICCLLHNYRSNEQLQLDNEAHIETVYGAASDMQLRYIPRNLSSVPLVGQSCTQELFIYTEQTITRAQ